MDESLAGIPGEGDTEFRRAVHWWIRLKQTPDDSHTLRDFSRWLGQRVTHRKAFARVETLWQTVQATLIPLEAGSPGSDPASQSTGNKAP